jgi:hypothetical protein
MTNSEQTKELAQAVLKHADENYSKGWDYIVECWTLAEIEDEIKACRTVAGAIKKMKYQIDLRAEFYATCF